MNERDYLRLKRQFAEDYESKVKALDLIWQEISGGKKPPKEPQEVNNAPAGRGNAASAVEEFVHQWNAEPFSAKQVEVWITQVKGQSANRTTIIHKLRRMLNEGEIDLVTKGAGKRASLYIVPFAGSNEATNPTPETEVVEATALPVTAVEMASERDVEELRSLLAILGIDVGEFREGILADFSVEKVRDLTKEQIRAVINRYVPKTPAVLDIPDEDFPF